MNQPLIKAMQAAAAAAAEQESTAVLYGRPEGTPRLAPWPAQPCRVVFLDFDGVLNNESCIADLNASQRFHPPSVQALNEILRRTGALIVISSSWRCLWPLAELVEFLESEGVLPRRVVGRTPELETERGVEINAWLKSAPYPVASFVILDDMEDMAMHRGRLVLTSFENGLTQGHALEAVEILSRPWGKGH